MHKILVDECIHKDFIIALEKAGFDIKTVFDLKLQGATDDVIFNTAQKEKRVLLTFDREFGDIFRFSISESYGVVVVLVSQMTRQTLVNMPTSFLKSVSQEELKGKLVVMGRKKIRIAER